MKHTVIFIELSLNGLKQVFVEMMVENLTFNNTFFDHIFGQNKLSNIYSIKISYKKLIGNLSKLLKLIS